jgi:hypothetical protein
MEQDLIAAGCYVVGLAILLTLPRTSQRLAGAIVRRGYLSPAVRFAFSGATVLPGVAMIAFAVEWGIAPAFLALCIVQAITPLALIPAVRLLPRRDLRAGGRRVVRFPYQAAAYCQFAAAAMLVVYVLSGGESYALTVAGYLTVGGISCRQIASRTGVGVGEAVEPDGFQVLYIRPFNVEDVPFVELERKPQHFLRDWFGALAGESHRFPTLDRFICSEVNASLGRFKALGNPTDFVPPGGAERLYVSDDTWQAVFRKEAARSVCLLMTTAISPPLLWELEQIRDLGIHQRLYIVTSPSTEMPTTTFRRLLYRTAQRPTKPARIWSAPAPISWPEFCAYLHGVGFEIAPHYPGTGAIVGFDDDRRGVVLATGLRSATDIVAVLSNARTSR